MIGAAPLSELAPLLVRLETLSRRLMLGSDVVMLLVAVVLLSDRYMTVSAQIARLLS